MEQQYHVLRFGDLYTLQREFKGKQWYHDIGQRVTVSLLSDHPRSGHPKSELTSMIQKW